MADIFVNKSGNDSNTGLSAATAKLTISAGKTAAGLGGSTVTVQAGFYNESVTVVYSGASNPDITVKADSEYGPVVMDGQSTLTNGMTMQGGGIGGNAGQMLFSGFVVRNYLGRGIFMALSGQSGATVERCILHDNAEGLRGSGRGTIVDSLIYDCTTGILTLCGNQSRNTFHNCGIGISGSVATRTIKNNLFSDNTRHLQVSSLSSPTNVDFNLYFPVGVSNDFRNELVVHTTFASWQGSGGTPDPNSVNVDPLLTDKAKKMLRPSLSSPAPSAMSLVPAAPVDHVGYEKFPTKGVSNTSDLANWDTNAIITDITKVGDNYQLTTPPDGDLKTGVIDFGLGRTIRRLTLEGIVNYPSEIFDFDKTDTAPNIPTLRFRGSNTIFAPGDGTPAFTEVEIGTDINTSFRFFQVEVTFRNDGAAA